MPSRFTTVMTIVAGYILLLVVVCPATPTPVAISKGKQVDIALTVAPVLDMGADRPVFDPILLADAASACGPDRFALTCSLLC